MLCGSCAKDKDHRKILTIVLPGEIGKDLPYPIDICSDCMKEFWKYNPGVLANLFEQLRSVDWV